MVGPEGLERQRPTVFDLPIMRSWERAELGQVDIPATGAEGVLACLGGEFGGWSLFIKDGRLHYAHNFLKTKEFLLSSSRPVPAGKHRVSMSFTPTGSSTKPAVFTGDIAIAIDGEAVGELKGIKTAGQYSAITGYGLLIGRNSGTPVSHEYHAPFAFTGGPERVLIEVKQDK